MKICTKCNKEKEHDEFGKDNTTKDKLTRQCKECRKLSFKKWYIQNPDKVKDIIEKTKEYRNNYYRNPSNKERYNLMRIERDYNINSETYLKLKKEQNNKCAICGLEEQSARCNNLAVDHCHITNKVRGLLCNKCNRAIGLINDDISILEKAIIYLKKKI